MTKTTPKRAQSFNLKNFLLILLGGVISAVGVSFFFYPVSLYDSGVSGLSMFLNQITSVPISVFLIAINIPLFLFGLRRQGKIFTIYSVFAVVVFSIATYIFMHLLPYDLESVSPLAGTDRLLCAIFGGVICGIGSGLAIRNGGAIDGIDVLSIIFAKKIGISLGSFVMIFNLIVYNICGIVMQSWEVPLYSIIAYFVGSRVVDYVVQGFDREKCAMIVTVKSDEISEALSEEFKASGTIIEATGGYTKDKKEIVYFIVNRFEINKMRSIVQGIDPSAFISLLDTTEIIRAKKQER